MFGEGCAIERQRKGYLIEQTKRHFGGEWTRRPGCFELRRSLRFRELLGRVPIFGICLGHQLLSLALGAKTFKLKFGHHGVNYPVLNVDTGRVEITSQNHGFAVDMPSLEAVGGRVTHINLYDQSLEGFVHSAKGVMAVQYHPEAAPGPHDLGYLFDRFIELMRERRELVRVWRRAFET